MRSRTRKNLSCINLSRTQKFNDVWKFRGNTKSFWCLREKRSCIWKFKQNVHILTLVPWAYKRTQLFLILFWSLKIQWRLRKIKIGASFLGLCENSIRVNSWIMKSNKENKRSCDWEFVPSHVLLAKVNHFQSIVTTASLDTPSNTFMSKIPERFPLRSILLRYKSGHFGAF